MFEIDRLHSLRIRRPLSPRESIKDGKYVFLQAKRKDGSLLELDVDQFAGQKFMENSNGFIANDIMVFEQCQSDSVARAVLSRMKVLHPQSIDQNMTVDEMFENVLPSNFGSPAEFVSLHSFMAQKAYDRYQSDLAKKEAELKFKESVVQPSLVDSEPKNE